jgi:hypothetical protein
MLPMRGIKVLINLHRCVAFCIQKTNHSSRLYICLTFQSCCHFDLDVTCSCTDLARHSHSSNMYLYFLNNCC